MAKERPNSRLRRMRQMDVEALELALITAKALGHRTIPRTTLQTILGGIGTPIIFGIIKLHLRQGLAQGGPLLTSMIVEESGIPGGSFFDILRKSGIHIPDNPGAERDEWERQIALVDVMDPDKI